MFWLLFLFVSGLKVLLIPSYKSTDFEVHRNWLSITHSLPLSKWYFEDRSEWTLDYPPFFAYFEWLLSQFAVYFDANMLKVENLNYDSRTTVLFQRFSVIITDLVYAFGVKRCLESLGIATKYQKLAGTVSLLFNVGLLFVDHIHFQYNGFLFGILLFSIALILEKKFIKGAFLFAALLNFKHIFIYVAPAFGVFLLKDYVFNKEIREIVVVKFLKLVIAAGTCVALSFGPFIDQFPQVLSRLFPFKRGLTHAYWAPNFWAIYNFIEKVGVSVLKKSSGVSTSSGLVQEFDFKVLPNIPPMVTFLLTGLMMIPCVLKLWKSGTKDSFLRAITICSMTSFMFGWHVHEKAILMTIIPLGLSSLSDFKDAKWFIFLSIVGHYSLFPLLFPIDLVIIKYGLYISYICAINLLYTRVFKGLKLSSFEKLYLCGFAFLTLYEYFIQHVLRLTHRMPFLPLMMCSVYCAFGVLYFYVNYYSEFVFDKRGDGKVKSKRK
ncbi:ALG8 family protein [Megaselia abdita]